MYEETASKLGFDVTAFNFSNRSAYILLFCSIYNTKHLLEAIWT